MLNISIFMQIIFVLPILVKIKTVRLLKMLGQVNQRKVSPNSMQVEGIKNEKQHKAN